MRFREFSVPLLEGKAHRLTAATGEPFIAVENPTREQMDVIRRRAPYQELKGLLSKDGKRLIVWPSFFAHHGEALGFILGHSVADLFPDGPDEDMVVVPEMKDWIGVFPTKEGVFTDDGGGAKAVIDGSEIVRRLYA